jgi:hypothetical protein
VRRPRTSRRIVPWAGHRTRCATRHISTAAVRRRGPYEAALLQPPDARLGTSGGVYALPPVEDSWCSGMKWWLAPLTIILVALACGALAGVQSRESANWRTFEVPDFGTKIQYPADIFSPAGQPEMGLGQRFERADGRAVLSIYARPNKAGETPRTYLRKHLRVNRSALDYMRIARSFFAVSSERDGIILYSRCNFSGGARGVIHCFDLKYPRQEKRSWDAVVTRISLSLRPLES